jgi:predicted ATP-dependent endonuclease of OLD family
MELVKAKFTNFRGINEPCEISLKNFTTIVGKNDAGKSTILKGLDLFFNNSKATKDIKCVFSDEDITTIELFLRLNNQKLTLEHSKVTTFEQEGLLNEKGLLQISKRWDTSKNKSPESYIYRKKQINEQHYEYEKLPTSGKTQMKLIHDAIKKMLPAFHYFKADSPLDESDRSIQSYFKTQAEQHLNQFSVTSEHNELIDLTKIENYVGSAIQTMLTRMTSKINNVLNPEENVKSQVTFNWSNLINISFNSGNKDQDIPLSFRGDGFRRITMMAYFESLAEESVNEHQNIIFAFEEPETFLHPSAQEELYTKLRDITENDYQVIITTHSPVIVANSNKNELIHIKNEGKYEILQNITEFNEIINDLGINPQNQFFQEFNSAKLLLLVEGADDVKAFNYVSEVYKEFGLIDFTFQELGIVIIPIGGCGAIKHWVTLRVLDQLSKPYFVLQDSDKISENAESKTKNELIKLGINEDSFYILRKRALENYINKKMLERLIPGLSIHYDDYTNVKNLCKKHEHHHKLKGTHVAELFVEQSLQDLRESFAYNDSEDEFIDIYTFVKKKLNQILNVPVV